jgi:hypothetical protein
LWRGLRVEHRISEDVAHTEANEAFDTTLLQFMVARKLSRDWTLLGRNYLLATNYKNAATSCRTASSSAGLPRHRPQPGQRADALRYKAERDESGLTLLDGQVVNGTSQDVRTRAHIVSTHADWHPSRPWWLTGRIAGKWQRPVRLADGAASTAASVRCWSPAASSTTSPRTGTSACSAPPSRGQSGGNQYAYGVEVGRLLRQNLWLSAGYNWTGFEGDRDLNGYEYTQRCSCACASSSTKTFSAGTRCATATGPAEDDR